MEFLRRFGLAPGRGRRDHRRAGLKAAVATHKYLNLHNFIELRLIISLIALALMALAPVAMRHLRRRPGA